MTARNDTTDHAAYPRDLSKPGNRASLAIAQARADLDAVYRALLYTLPSTVLELVNLLDAPALRPGITENRVQATLFLLREHGLADSDNTDTIMAPFGGWLRKDPS